MDAEILPARVEYILPRVVIRIRDHVVLQTKIDGGGCRTSANLIWCHQIQPHTCMAQIRILQCTQRSKCLTCAYVDVATLAQIRAEA